jgi:hypothetical protein
MSDYTENEEINELYSYFLSVNTNFDTSLITTEISEQKSLPTEDDYKNGYVKRYFAKLSSSVNSPIYEVSVDTYREISDSPFYTIVSMNWRITGNLNDNKSMGMSVEDGVITYNKKVIESAENIIPGVSKKFVSATEFYNSNY